MKLQSILFLVLVPLGLFGQSVSDQQAKDDFWRLQQRGNSGSVVELSYSDIEGTPYLNQSFQTGQIFTKKKILYGSFPLRYNAYTDNFEFKEPDKKIMELNAPGMVDKIKLGDTIFVFASYMKKEDRSIGFFQLMNSGKAEGLIRYWVDFIKAVPTGAYQDAQPAMFSNIQKDYYVRFGSSPAIKIYKNSDFLKALPDKKSEIIKFIKKEKIHASRGSDLLKLVNYYNSL